MTYLRHAVRHVQKRIADHVETHLDTLGWKANPAPFGTTPIVVQRARIEEALGSSITGNLVAISFADEGEDMEAQLGGGLATVALPFFVDCVGVEEPIALAIASDIKDLLSGRYPDSSRFLDVRDYSATAAGTEVSGYRLELLDVVREKVAGAEWRARWHVVKAVAELTHPGEA